MRGGLGSGCAAGAAGGPWRVARAVYGHMADGVGVAAAVRRTACFMAVCVVRGVQGAFDLVVGDVVLVVNAVGVDGEQGGDGVPGPAGDLGGWRAGVEP